MLNLLLIINPYDRYKVELFEYRKPLIERNLSEIFNDKFYFYDLVVLTDLQNFLHLLENNLDSEVVNTFNESIVRIKGNILTHHRENIFNFFFILKKFL